MARLARVVIPGQPHHVTQRGNRRQPVFFEDRDYRFYLHLISAAARSAGTQIWAYCLMPNHVHFIMVPSREDGLRAAFAETHRRYTAHINARHAWSGHLWQGRFGSTVMDERHLMAALRYVALNPVRAGLTHRAADWPWSSARAHLAARSDGVVEIAPVLDRTDDFENFLDQAEDAEAMASLRRSCSTGRPIGAKAWIEELEIRAGRSLTPPSAARNREAMAGYFGDSLLNCSHRRSPHTLELSKLSPESKSYLHQGFVAPFRSDMKRAFSRFDTRRAASSGVFTTQPDISQPPL